MLIASSRHRSEDLELWTEMEAADLVHGQSTGLQRKVDRSIAEIKSFAERGPCYAGVSWGKDSVVMAHLIQRSGLTIPLVWIKQIPLYNPDCELVRDSFLSMQAMSYHEIVVLLRAGHYTWHATGSIEAGFSEAYYRFGHRHISGIRAGESGGRKIRMRRHGLSSANACAPLGWWTEQDVFGYLAAHDLPVHPVYAMLGDGRWERKHIRTCRLDGRAGDQFGRAEWEREYYGDVLNRLNSTLPT